VNTECKFLLAALRFRDAEVIRVQLGLILRNLRFPTRGERIGGIKEGVLTAPRLAAERLRPITQHQACPPGKAAWRWTRWRGWGAFRWRGKKRGLPVARGKCV